MNRLEFELESFATAFLGMEIEESDENGGLARIYKPARDFDESHAFDIEAMAEVPEALNAFIANQHRFDV